MFQRVFFVLLIFGAFPGILSTQTSVRIGKTTDAQEDGARRRSEIARLNERGAYFLEQEPLDSALHFFRMAEAKLAGIPPTGPGAETQDQDQYAQTYDHLSLAFQKLQRLEKAMQYANLSMDLAISRYGENNPVTCRNYCRIGDLFFTAEEYLYSLDYYQKAAYVLEKQALPGAETAEGKAFLGELYYRLAETYSRLSRPLSEVEPLYQKSLTLMEDESKRVSIQIGQSLKTALGYMREGDPASALETFTRADSLWKSHQTAFGKDKSFQLLRAEIIRMRGYYWKWQSQYEKTLSCYKEYVRITDSLGISVRECWVLKVLMEIGEIYGQRVRTSESNADSSVYFTQKALHKVCRTFDTYDITRVPEPDDVISHPYTYGILKQLARYHQLRAFAFGDEAEKIIALKTGLSLLELADKLHSRYLEEAAVLRGGRLGSLIAGSMFTFDAGMGFSYMLLQLEPGPDLLETGFYYLQRLKAQQIRLAHLKEEAQKLENLPDSVLEKERMLLSAIQNFENRVHQARKDADAAAVETWQYDSLFHAKRAYRSLIAGLSADYPGYWKDRFASKPATLQEVRQALKAEEVLVEYSVDKSTIRAFIIARDAAPQYIELISMEPEKVEEAFRIADQLNQLLGNSIMQRESSRANFVEWSHQLYEYFIQPLEAQLAGKKKLIIIGDGPTHVIPFGVLLPKDEVKSFTELDYLIRKYEIAYHYSSTLFVAGRKATSPPRSGIYAFAPVYDRQELAAAPGSIREYSADSALRAFDEDGNYAPLPESERETSSIIGLFDQQGGASNRLALRQNASESSLKAALGAPYRIVHIAGHSYADLENPGFSGIACAGLEAGDEDGTLHAGEINLLRIKADLVTLSSCESGYGKPEDNDGLLGLNRAFVYAGAPNVVFSLWKVYDKVSASLMVDFYTHILEEQSYSESLRAAKLRVLADPATASPHFWAAYMLIGG